MAFCARGEGGVVEIDSGRVWVTNDKQVACTNTEQDCVYIVRTTHTTIILEIARSQWASQPLPIMIIQIKKMHVPAIWIQFYTVYQTKST